MTDYIAFDGVVPADADDEHQYITMGGTIPVGISAVAASVGAMLSGQIWMELTVPWEGADPELTFAIGSHGFTVVMSGGSEKRVYPAIRATAALRDFLSTGESATTVDLLADAKVTPTNGIGSYRIRDIVRDKAMFDIVVTFYQWDDVVGSTMVLWSGYWRGVDRTTTNSGVCIMSCKVSSLPARDDMIISDIISQVSTPTAPSDSFGKMPTRTYGNFRTGINASDPNSSNPSVFLGYGARFIEGVVVDQNQSALSLKVRFTKNDGVAGSKLVQEGNADQAHSRGDLWIWLPSANTYALIDPASTVITNDGTETTAVIAAEPVVYVALRPGAVGSKMSAGFVATAYKITNEDPTDYLETTSSDYIIAFDIPSVSVSGLVVTYVAVVWHIKGNGSFVGTRDYQIGIWDEFNFSAPGWLGNAGKTDSRTGFTNALETTIQGPSGGYIASDFDNHVGQETIAEFSRGQFIGRDGNSADTPLQLLFQVNSASKDGIRFYDCGLVVKGKLSVERTKRITRVSSGVKGYDVQGRPRNPDQYGSIQQAVPGGSETSEAILAAAANQMTFLCTGQFQNDPSGVYDTAGQEIRKGVSIAQHIIASIGGMAVNTTPGTLGNFTDAKVEEVAGEKNIDVSFGPSRVVTIGAAKDEIQKRHPLRLHRRAGVWNAFYHEMNPHPSRFYRSSSDFVRISARKHILDGSLQVMQIPFEQIVNRVTVNYGHAYGTNRAMRSFLYDNLLSQLLFGVRPEIIVDEPWITCRDLTADAEPAKFLAHFMGRYSARPLLTPINVQLSKEFADLECGHVTGFDSDMEDVGYYCPAYRLGKFNYAFAYKAADAGGEIACTNQAFQPHPRLMPGLSQTSETYLFADQQFGGVTFGIPGGGAYTTVPDGWEYFSGTEAAPAWTPLSNVRRSDGGDPLAVFKAAAGVYTVSWDMPDPSTWKKAEFRTQFSSEVCGPQIGVRMKYVTSTVPVIGTQQSLYPAKWYGRLFEVLEASRKPGGLGDYPYIDAVLAEIM